MDQSLNDITGLVRKNILNMKPYSSARDEFQGPADIFLDANENPYPSPYNRYPDPLQRKLKEKLGELKKLPPGRIFLGNGSDEAIDLLIRAFCEPHTDSLIICEPTYGMYAVCAAVNAVRVKPVKLTADFDLDLPAIRAAIDDTCKLIFLCSPNNPTGNLLSRNVIIDLLTSFNGLVVIDEAYIDFTNAKSFSEELNNYSNLVILQTFSKAWGLAGLRLGMCYASDLIISILNKIKYPYNINIQTQELALDALEDAPKKARWVKEILLQRAALAESLSRLNVVGKIFPTDANFLLVKVKDAPGIYKYLTENGIIVRDRSRVTLCENCLRITVGTPTENKKLIEALKAL
jgi:histidinol-phosphate aminotransferase